MKPEELRVVILEYLAEQTDREGHQMFDVKPLAARLRVPATEVQKAVEWLHQRGLVETVFGCETAAITPQGYARARPDDPLVPKPGGTRVTIHGNVNGPVAIDRSHAHTTSITVENLLSTIEVAIDQSQEIPPEKKALWRQVLDEMRQFPSFLETVRKLFQG